VNTPSANPPKTSAYSRSPLLRWGVWVLVLAAAVIAWSVLRESPKQEKLQTAEGTLVDYGPEASSARPLYLLRIQKPDGTLAMFGSWDALQPPKSGWQKGQPIHVKSDSRHKLYQVVVAGEVILDVEKTQGKESKN
jgi:hypothetical protein